MTIKRDCFSGGAGQIDGYGGGDPNEDPNLWQLLNPLSGLASETELGAIGVRDCRDRMVAVVKGLGRYQYNTLSTLVACPGLIIVPADARTAGRWCRMPGQVIDQALPFTFATADAAVLMTTPTGAVLVPEDFYWEVTTPFTGGASSAIGVSSSKTGFTTKGDLLGGASGDVLATLVNGAIIPGTVGAKMGAIATRRGYWVGGETLRNDRITSVFTAGVGNVHAVWKILANPG
jgi:hypothetical protein